MHMHSTLFFDDAVAASWTALLLKLHLVVHSAFGACIGSRIEVGHSAQPHLYPWQGQGKRSAGKQSLAAVSLHDVNWRRGDRRLNGHNTGSYVYGSGCNVGPYINFSHFGSSNSNRLPHHSCGPARCQAVWSAGGLDVDFARRVCALDSLARRNPPLCLSPSLSFSLPLWCGAA